MSNLRDVLISIKERHVVKIISGTKTVEVRRRALVVPTNTRIWIYSTLPTGKVTAVAQIEKVTSGSVESIWRRFSTSMGITRSEYSEYMDGATAATAIALSHVRKLSAPISLAELRKANRKFHPPQFFSWLAPEDKEYQLLAGRVYR